jgi:hypothetical protein
MNLVLNFYYFAILTYNKLKYAIYLILTKLVYKIEINNLHIYKLKSLFLQ